MNHELIQAIERAERLLTQNGTATIQYGPLMFSHGRIWVWVGNWQLLVVQSHPEVYTMGVERLLDPHFDAVWSAAENIASAVNEAPAPMITWA